MHLGVTTSPHTPFPTGSVTLPMYNRSPPLRLSLSHNRKRAPYLFPPFKIRVHSKHAQAQAASSRRLPSMGARYVMSPTYFWLGPVAVKSCCNRLGATGRLCLEFVVALNFFAALARNPCRRMLSAMVLRSCGCPASARSRTNLGDPERPLRASNAFLTASSSRFRRCCRGEGLPCCQRQA